MCGTLIGFGAFIMQTDSVGNTIWAKSVVFPKETYPTTFQPTNDGGLIMAGRTMDNFFQNDMCLIKFDSLGNYQWGKQFGGTGWDLGMNAIQASDGGFVLCGRYSFSGTKNRVAIIKTTSTGSVQWASSFSDTSSFSASEPTGIVETNSGYMIAGKTLVVNSNPNDYDGLLLHVNTNGNLLWGKTFGRNEFDSFSAIKESSDGNFIVSGWIDTISGGIAREMLLMKITESGSILWAKSYGSTGDDVALAVEEASDGYMLAGTSLSFGTGMDDFYLIKTNSLGNIVWTNSYGDTGEENLYDMKRTQDNRYILCGSTLSFNAFSDMAYIVKADSLGESGCFQINAPTNQATLQLTSKNNGWLYFSGAGTDTVISCTVQAENVIHLTFCFWNEVANMENASAISIYPNPVAEQLHLNNIGEQTNASVYDLAGKLIFQKEIEKDATLNVATLPAGSYMLMLRFGDKVINQRFIKE